MKTRYLLSAWVKMAAALLLLPAGASHPQTADSTKGLTFGASMRKGMGNSAFSEWHERTAAIKPSSAWPAATEDCALIYDPRAHRLVLFGGKNDADENVNEVWALDVAHNAWQQIMVTGDSPPPSEDHTAIYDPLGHRLILYGGENGPTTNNLWAFDLQKHRWHNLGDSTAPRREDHTAVFDSRAGRMVIFGGRDNEFVNLYEVWGFDLDPQAPGFEKWHNLSVAEKHPPGRSDHVAVFDSLKNRMIVFSGWDKDAKEYLSDTWGYYFDPAPYVKGRWKQIKTKQAYPPKRRHAVGAYDADRNWFVICGGFGEEGVLNDVWAFDLAFDAWLNITPGPPPRIDHQAVFDPVSKRLILYGGDARFRGKMHDLWELNILQGLPEELRMKEARADRP